MIYTWTIDQECRPLKDKGGVNLPSTKSLPFRGSLLQDHSIVSCLPHPFLLEVWCVCPQVSLPNCNRPHAKLMDFLDLVFRVRGFELRGKRGMPIGRSIFSHLDAVDRSNAFRVFQLSSLRITGLLKIF